MSPRRPPPEHRWWIVTIGTNFVACWAESKGLAKAQAAYMKGHNDEHAKRYKIREADPAKPVDRGLVQDSIKSRIFRQ